MSDLWTIVYVSSAWRVFDNMALSDILAASRDRNREAGITGLLLYSGGNIIQCLEGPAESVRETFARISRDGRHHDIWVLLDEQVNERSFAQWEMACLEVDANAVDSAVTSLARLSSGDARVQLLASFWREMSARGGR